VVEYETAPEGSFIADDTSFSRAPLSSRLPHISPHRLTTTSHPSHSRRPAHAAGAGAGEEDISDSGSLIDEEEEDEQMREKRDRARRREKGLDKELLSGLGAELQEALMVEDLLFVLMVRFLSSFSSFPFPRRRSVLILRARSAQGIEGRYIEFDPSYSPSDEFERLQGAQFVVDRGLGASSLFLPF
jgi:gamma-tubulin complex component 2